MKIIGGHDYYDSALAYGQDNEVVFVRQTVEHLGRTCPLYRGYSDRILKDNYRWSNGGYSSEFTIKINGVHSKLILIPVVVYIGSKRYGGIQVSGEYTSDIPIDVFWSYSSFKEYINSHGYEIANPEKEKYSWYTPVIEEEVFDTLEKFFTPSEATVEQLNWLVNNRVAIAVWRGDTFRSYGRSEDDRKWKCNVSTLKDLFFYRAVDAFTLFQELSMFVGGVLPRNPNPMVEITDDKVKVEKHGFDKWSFRKHKDDNTKKRL